MHVLSTAFAGGGVKRRALNRRLNQNKNEPKVHQHIEIWAAVLVLIYYITLHICIKIILETIYGK